jgi:polysaccharide pyruvyl transferase WcaK-like protein
MAELKVLLTGASLETRNMGVSALAVGAVQSYYASEPLGGIALLDYSRQEKAYTLSLKEGPARIGLLPIRFSWKLYLRNNIATLIGLVWLVNILPLQGIKRAILKNNALLRQIVGADFIAALSGGDSFSDIYGLRNLIYVSLPQILALAMKKPLVLLPQTVGPFKGVIARKIAGYILSRAALVYTRDRSSMEDVRDCLGPNARLDRFRFCYDVGFALQPMVPKEVHQETLKEATDRPLIGFNVSGLLYRGGKSGNNIFGLKVDYPQLVEDIIEYLINQKGASVLLVPHVFGESDKGEADTPVCKMLYEKLQPRYGNRISLAAGCYDQSEIKYVIGRCEFFIGSRMHACIAAVSQSVPAVSIAYSRKFIGVMDTVGMGDCVADPRAIQDRQILDMIGWAFDNRIGIRQGLEKKMPEVRETVFNLFHEIRNGIGMNSMNC